MLIVLDLIALQCGAELAWIDGLLRRARALPALMC
jgi:hypothetical protein